MSNGKEERGKRKLLTVSEEAKRLLWDHRRILAIGLAIMVVNRLAGFVLPASSKYLIDTVIGEGRGDLLLPLALAAGAATLVQAGTSFALSQVVSVEGQHAIADMRRRVEAHVLR
ncbi:MAG TPA: hypothetical protein VFI91_05625, partial [Longimicrobiaceae bacterium]|nr:hypothetical protein [Longimicrobiaceae bacterium]